MSKKVEPNQDLFEDGIFTTNPCIFCSNMNEDDLTPLNEAKVAPNLPASKYLKDFPDLDFEEDLFRSAATCSACVAVLRRLHSFKEEVKSIERSLFKDITKIRMQMWKADDFASEELTEKLIQEVRMSGGYHLVALKSEAPLFKETFGGKVLASLKILKKMTGYIRSCDKGRIFWSFNAGLKVLGTKNVKGITCLTCDHVFQTFASAQDHLGKGCSKDHTCKFCGKSFISMIQLRNHERDHGGCYPCLLCEKTFTRKASLKEHLSRHKGVKDKECHLCHKMFYPTSYYRHMSSVHPKEDALIHRCAACGKRFGQKYRLRLHEASHRERNFDCDRCPGKSFKTERHLKVHWNQVHRKDRSNSATMLCQKCGGTFKKGAFHECPPEVTSVWLAPETHACDVCGKKFGTDDDLLIHQSENHGLLGFTSTDKGSFHLERIRFGLFS